MIKLKNGLTLNIEQQDERARLIVYKDTMEIVCRKTTVSQLKTLELADNVHLFKGRLQLYKSGDTIIIQVKGTQAGCVNLNEFRQLMIRELA